MDAELEENATMAGAEVLDAIPLPGSAPPRPPELAFVATPFAKSTAADLCFLCIEQELACSSRSTLPDPPLAWATRSRPNASPAQRAVPAA